MKKTETEGFMQDSRLTEQQKKVLSAGGITLFLLLSGVVFWYAGRPLIQFARDPEHFRAWVDSRGLIAHVLFLGMVVLQVLVAVIPGEPLEIAAGYAFGAVEGTVLCMLGTFLGSILVFQLVRTFGIRAIEVFFPMERIRSLRFLQNEKRLNRLVFLIFFLPGTPKDILCYFIGLTNMPLRTWAAISLIARIPSIVTSTVGGNALGMERYAMAAAVFAATLAVSGLGLLVYRGISRRRNSSEKD